MGEYAYVEVAVVATVDLERCMTGARIFRVIVSEFSHREEPSPIILLVIDKGSEVGFHDTTLPFGLTIGLKVKSGGESPLDSQKIA